METETVSFWEILEGLYFEGEASPSIYADWVSGGWF